MVAGEIGMRREFDRIVRHIIDHIENENYEIALSLLKYIVVSDRDAYKKAKKQDK